MLLVATTALRYHQRRGKSSISDPSSTTESFAQQIDTTHELHEDPRAPEFDGDGLLEVDGAVQRSEVHPDFLRPELQVHPNELSAR